MITVIAGTNRKDSNSLRVARIAEGLLRETGVETRVLDLAELPTEILRPDAYAVKPESFRPFQDAVAEADGLLTVVPEYNGSYPGALKLFIDMLQFPESLVETPSAFIGIAAGRWGALRAVEQLEMVFQYRSAHLYGRRVFIPSVGKELDGEGGLRDPDLRERLGSMVRGFAGFCDAMKR